MRIAFLVGRFPSLSETFILNQITGLIDRGHEVDIYARRPDEGDRVHPDIEKYRLRDRVIYRQMPRSAPMRWLKAIGPISRNPGISIKSLNPFRHGRDATSLKLLYWVATVCGAGVPPVVGGLQAGSPPHKHYDILHGHFGPNGLLALALRDVGAFNPDARIVTTFYGYDVHRYPRNHGQHVYRRLFQRGDLVLTLSETMKRDLLPLGAVEAKTIVHHIGTDPGRFTLSIRQPPSDGVVRLVSVARLVEKKGLQYAIDAVAKVQAAGVEVVYDIVGDGELRENLKSQISNLKLDGVVNLLGWKTQPQVAEVLGKAHILLAPSITASSGDQEGTPVALMEAMAMGLPVISTHHSGIPEMIQDGVSGYLVAERDAAALANRILELSKHPGRWSDMGRAGREIVEGAFDTNRLNDRLVELYRSI